MFARMATFTIDDQAAVGDMPDKIREAVRPIVEALEGWQAATQMLDRESGKLAVINYFDTQENMAAAEATFESMPQRLPEELQDRIRQVAGGRQSVERFEVLYDTRMTG